MAPQQATNPLLECMVKKTNNHKPKKPRHYPDELKQQAVQMLIEGHAAQAIVQNLGIASTSMLYRWRKELLAKEGQTASTLEIQVRQLQEQLRHTERERDILKKALAIFSHQA